MRFWIGARLSFDLVLDDRRVDLRRLGIDDMQVGLAAEGRGSVRVDEEPEEHVKEGEVDKAGKGTDVHYDVGVVLDDIRQVAEQHCSAAGHVTNSIGVHSHQPADFQRPCREQLGEPLHVPLAERRGALVRLVTIGHVDRHAATLDGGIGSDDLLDRPQHARIEASANNEKQSPLFHCKAMPPKFRELQAPEQVVVVPPH